MLKKVRKFKKRVNGFFRVTEGPSTNGYASFDARPEWVDAVTPIEDPHDIRWDEAQCTPGLSLVDPFSVMRSDSSNNVLGIRCRRGFRTGKHVIEFEWPSSSRGKVASIGVCHEDAPLTTHKGTLIGDTPNSWGWDMVRRRAYYCKKSTGSAYPPQELSPTIPDRILMFIDMDEGTLSFGCEGGTYWGVTHLNIRRQGKEVYPVVGIGYDGAVVKISYKGSSEDYCIPVTMATDAVDGAEDDQTQETESNCSDPDSPTTSASSELKSPSSSSELKAEIPANERNSNGVGVHHDKEDGHLYYDNDASFNYEYDEHTHYTDDNVPLTEL